MLFNYNHCYYYSYLLLLFVQLHLHADVDRLKANLVELTNGSVRVEWDPIILEGTSNISFTYDIEVINVENGGDIAKEENVTTSDSRFSFTFDLVGNTCISFMVSITPIINTDFSGARTLLFQGN